MPRRSERQIFWRRQQPCVASIVVRLRPDAFPSKPPRLLSEACAQRSFDAQNRNTPELKWLRAILERQTILRANSYYKNAAVFDHSQSRLPDTRFMPPDAQVIAAPHRGTSNFRDIKNLGLPKLRGLRRRSRWLSLRTLRWRSRHHD
jgi:hypothetical protein